MFTNRRPYYGLKMSTTDFFREPVRYLKESNTQESMMEKPYLEDEYPKMHLKIPDFKYKPRKKLSFLGPIADGLQYGGLAMIDFGEAKCAWDMVGTISSCIEEPLIITITASHLFTEEFEFTAGYKEDTIGTRLIQLPGTEAISWDKQDFLLEFPVDANGTVTICGNASTHTLVSQTFETVVAGMPVGIHLVGGFALIPIEKGQSKPATLLKSVYGIKGASCGCITINSSCFDGSACVVSSIGYTTQQMDVNESQSLSVIDSVEGCDYEWIISSGGGSLDGSVYTAPSSNVNCDENPIILLKVKSFVVDTLSISINDYYGVAGKQFSHCSERTSTSTYCWATTFMCDSSTVGDPYVVSWFWNSGNNCGSACESFYPKDDRTEVAINGGCCPYQLL